MRNPLVIGGVGGSGTRVYRDIAVEAGYQMLVAPAPLRWKRPDLHDNHMLMKYFYPRWVDRYLTGQLGAPDKRRMQNSLRRWLWLCGPTIYGRGKWGWKNPRSSLLIPFFKEMYPDMRYIHVVRDGRDQAFHPTFPYTRHQEAVLSPAEIAQEDHLRKALHWARVNELAERTGKAELGDRFLVSRLEDLCADPLAESRRVLTFLGVSDESTAERAAACVRVPKSLGRWQQAPCERLSEVEEAIGADLVRYGYHPASLAETER